MKSNTRLGAVGVLACAFGAWTMGSSPPAISAASTYQKTCRNFTLTRNVLSALCKKNKGLESQTSIVLKGIENVGGTLTVRDPYKNADFYVTCVGTAIFEATLSSSCRKSNGQYQLSRILINGIENIDGVLKYTSSPL